MPPSTGVTIDLSGRTALVTGGSIGIGRAAALALARCGADVVITYLTRPNEAKEVMEAMRALGVKAEAYKCDVADAVQVDSMVQQAAKALGGHIDILVNNAGSLIKRVPIAEMSAAHWRTVMAVNLDSVFYVTHAVIPHMNTGWGRVINMSSVAGRNGGGKGAAAYAAAKGGMLSLTWGLAKELGPRGITVNAITPGTILGTAFHPQFSAPEVIKSSIAGTPLARAGTPDDVAGAVLFYASELGAFANGDVAEINGGTWFV
jgi:3-oxoacyl-[acyl-carrier protein] reductase